MDRRVLCGEQMALGVVVGLILAAGYELPLGERFTLPLGIRVEPVFGSGIPIPVLAHTGIRYNL